MADGPQIGADSASGDVRTTPTKKQIRIEPGGYIRHPLGGIEIRYTAGDDVLADAWDGVALAFPSLVDFQEAVAQVEGKLTHEDLVLLKCAQDLRLDKDAGQVFTEAVQDGALLIFEGGEIKREETV